MVSTAKVSELRPADEVKQLAHEIHKSWTANPFRDRVLQLRRAGWSWHDIKDIVRASRRVERIRRQLNGR